jgi:signal peptidase I
VSRRGLTALCVALILTGACDVRRITVAGRAMEPALSNDQVVWVTGKVDPLERGDVVSFRFPNDESAFGIKRVIGLPGETIASTDGRITINGEPLDEPYVAEANRSNDTWGPVELGEGQYYLLGDNRANSSDSRAWGVVARELVTGKVFGD